MRQSDQDELARLRHEAALAEQRVAQFTLISRNPRLASKALAARLRAQVDLSRHHVDILRLKRRAEN